MRRALLVCVSVSHGNTAAVATAIAEVIDAEVRIPEGVTRESLRDYDVIGVGSGIFAGTHHPRLRRFVAELPAATGGRAFVFTTSGFGRAQHRPWERSLEAMLRSKGYAVLGSFSCRGYDTWLPLRLVGGVNKGHPDARDLAEARKFASVVAATGHLSRRTTV